MRLLLLIVALLSILLGSAQEINHTRDYYLAKSKTQKTIGYVLAGSGAALIISGIIVGNGDSNSDPNELDFGPNFDVGVWLLGGGIVAGLASIPFFIGSANNARKAATIGISQQYINIPHANSQVLIKQPAITLKIRL